jgi:hypothetical protein
MVRNLALIILMLVPSMTYAQLDSQLFFNGQNAEVLHSKKQITVVTPEVVQVPSTCTRQVPAGERQVCHNETRYRQMCSWIPASQQCRTEYERVCRPVYRTRQECSTGHSHRVCNRLPPRRVCTEEPRSNCRNRPENRGRCSTPPSHSRCREVPGEEVCRDVPGERTCRTVTYTEQQCDSHPHRRCQTIPGRNDCRSIPYDHQVCEMQMQYRTESYACTRPETVYRRTAKVLKNQVNVQIMTNGLVDEFPALISVTEGNQQFKSFSIEVKLLKEPKVFVVLRKKQVNIVSENAHEIVLNSDVILEVISRDMLPVVLPTDILKASVDSATKELILLLDGSISNQGILDLKITRKNKTIATMRADYPGRKVELSRMDNRQALIIDLSSDLDRRLRKNKMMLDLKLSTKFFLQGEILNVNKPDTSKLYQTIAVELK